MKKINKLIIKNRIGWFTTLGMETGIVGASLAPLTKTQRRVSASTLEMKMGWLAVAGAFRCYSSNITTNQNINVIPVADYPNADIQKSVILKENEGKIGIYRWVNKINSQTYVGSSGNLSARFRQYFNVNTLESKLKTGNSKIYSSLLKNGYSNFRLEVLEYCEMDILNEREQYYLDTLNPEYNILNYARSLRGFKHSAATIELMKEKQKLAEKYWSPESRRRLVITRLKGVSIIVVNTVTKEEQSFISGRDAANFIGITRGAISKYMIKQNFYLGRGFLVYKSSTALDDIINSEAYKEAVYRSENKGDTKYTHSESAKEAIRKANLGKKLSEEMKRKLLEANVARYKPVLVTNIETKERLEFPSILSASKSLGISKSHMGRCLTSNKPCKGYTVVYK